MSSVKELSTVQEGLEKGFLEDRKVYLKPIPRGGKMITDPNHTGYFMWEGASKQYCLAVNKDNNELLNPFRNEEEKKFFSEILDIDLNIHKKEDNFWHTFYVKITKDHKLMNDGVIFDLKDPMDNLRVRVLRQQEREIAPSWDKRFERMTYKFALVDEDYEDETSAKEMDIMEEVFTFWGSIKGSPKRMKEFLGVYWMVKKSLKNVPQDATKDFLTTEIKRIIDEDMDTVHSVIKDPDIEMKYLIFKGIQAGAINRAGVNTYSLVGDETSYSLPGFIDHLKFLKESTDPIYQKLEAQINSKK